MSIVEKREDELIGNFDLLEDALLQYEYLLAFTDELEVLPEEKCDASTKIKGCSSNAWMSLTAQVGGTLHLQATSDALVIRGILGMTSALIRDASCAEIAAWDPRFTHAPGIASQLNANRRSGVAAMLTHIREFACAASD